MSRVVHVAPPFTGGIGAAVAALMALGDDTLGHVHARDVDGGSAALVHCHHALAWPEARALGRRLGVPVAKTVHVLQAEQSRLRGLTTPTRSESMQAEALSEADALTIGSRAAYTTLVAARPELAGKLTVIAPPSPVPRRAREVGLALTRDTLLAVTRFDALKGTDLLVAVVARFLRADAARRVVIAGGLPDNARAEARWRDTFAAALGPDAARATFSGWLAPDALAARYAAAKVFVTTSRLETYGLALAEAVAAGCRAVATDLPVHREVAGAHARYAAPDAEALAATVEAAWRDDDDAARDGSPGDASSTNDLAARWRAWWRRAALSFPAQTR